MQFNKLQQKIIQSTEGAYLISAPVGTGKTTVLVERVVQAIERGLKPDEILCLTFTNRAAEEMRERIKNRISDREITNAITVKTFHGFCAQFVRSEAKQIGIDADFVIFDTAEQREVIKQALRAYPEYHLEESDKPTILDGMINKLYQHRLRCLEKSIGCSLPDREIESIEKNIDNKYHELLSEQHALDFNGLVLLVINALYGDEKMRNKWASRYRFIQLDEFQDTHLSEYLVVKELAKKHKNIAFIGDLDQTIYSWRGSEPYLVTALVMKHFAPVEELHLKINYRFNPQILAVIKSFLTSFKKSVTKEITTIDTKKNSEEKCVTVFCGHNFTEEINWTIDTINTIQKKDPNSRIAVLTRANYMINKAAEVFERKGVAHITVDKYDFFRRQEIKDIYAYIKIIFNKYDLESAYRISQRPSRNIGAQTLAAIRGQGASIGLKVSDFLSFKNYNYPEPYANLIAMHASGRMVVLDTETTGTNVLKDEIIQIYAVEVVNGERKKDFHYFLKNSIPVGASQAVHGISDEYLKKEGRDPKEVLQELKEFIDDDIVIGHNINFDLQMIIENSKRNDVVIDIQEYYDTLDIARRVVESKNYKLATLVELLGSGSKASHDAKDDVVATTDVLAELIVKLKENHEQRIMLFKKYSKKFIQLANTINTWGKHVQEKRPAQALEDIWRDSGLEEYYQKDTDREKRFHSIETLKDVFTKHDDESRPADVVMRELIQYASLVKDINFLGLDQGKIPIVTVHQVKGLEFDYVFIAGLNEFKFPIHRSDLEEEKRLFYVALTRARKKIHISYSQFNDYGKPISKSPFIDAIDSQYVELQ